MMASLLIENIAIYALQILLLVVVAALLSLLIRHTVAKFRLLYWQLVLLGTLLLPMIHPWAQRASGADTVNVTTTIVGIGAAKQGSAFPFTLAQVILTALLAGFLTRAVMLVLGFVRLRKYRRHSQTLQSATSWAAEARLLVSDEVMGPVTFGIFRPVVLLPANFPLLSADIRDAILCHEILHVRRRDWLFTVAEEVTRALFWFHPAMWWLLGEVQLAREQTVDGQVVGLLQCRDSYVDALLTIAGAPSRLDVAPAPLFLRKRHLKRRVFTILREVTMSQTKTISALAASLGMLGAACWLVTGAVPLRASPQPEPRESVAQTASPRQASGVARQDATAAEAPKLMAQTVAHPYSDPPPPPPASDAGPDQAPPPPQPPANSDGSRPMRIGGEIAAANLIEHPQPFYPALAKQARVQGIVKLAAMIGKDGHVMSLQLISGPPLLVQSAMDAVHQWVYRPTLLNGEPVNVLTTVDVNYTLSQ